MSAHLSPDSFTVADASIHALAHDLNRRHIEGDLEPSLVRVRVIDHGLEVGLHPLDGEHPAVWLTGNRVDDDIDAVGVVSGGRVFSLDDPSATLGRVSIVTIVSRRGEVATSSFDTDGRLDTGDGVTGLIVDLLKRAVGVATDPPPCRADVLFAQSWLMGVLDLVRLEDRVPSWREIEALHPAVEMLTMADGHPPTDGFIDVISAMGRAVEWRMLRDQLDDGRISVPGLNAGEGAWFDDGSFARRLLVDRPPIRLLRDEVRSRLPVDLWRRVEGSLDAAGVPRCCWPDRDHELRESA